MQAQEAALACAVRRSREVGAAGGGGGWGGAGGGRVVVSCDDEQCALKAVGMLRRMLGAGGVEEAAGEGGSGGGEWRGYAGGVEWEVLRSVGRASDEQVVGGVASLLFLSRCRHLVGTSRYAVTTTIAMAPGVLLLLQLLLLLL